MQLFTWEQWNRLKPLLKSDTSWRFVNEATGPDCRWASYDWAVTEWHELSDPQDVDDALSETWSDNALPSWEVCLHLLLSLYDDSDDES